MTIGGIPIIYLGDELGTLNDYHYREDKIKAPDSRWVHRQKFNVEIAKNRSNESTIEYRIFTGLQKLIDLRKEHVVFRNLNTEILDTKNPHVFGYLRQNETEKVIVLANFSEKIQEVILEKAFRMYEINFLKNIDKGEVVKTKNLVLEPYDLQFFSIG